MNFNTNKKGQWGEILRFGIVGVSAVTIQYLVYLLLVHLAGWGASLSNTVAYIVSFCFNFIASTRYTFRVKASTGRGIGFALCHLFNYLLQLLILNVAISLGMGKSWAPIPMFLISVPTNFILVRYTLKQAHLQNPFFIFRVKKEERWLALCAMVYTLFFNTLVVLKYWDRLHLLAKHYFKLFVDTFHISGFDPLSDVVISEWGTTYNIYRHPLLAYFMWIPCQLNQGLMWLTHKNCATIIMAAILVFCTFYSIIFLYRILREVLRLKQADSLLLTALFMSFSFVMVATSVPDHFCLSMFMLILTLYVSGKKLQAKHPFTKWQTILFFLVTAGISLSNGIKIFLANLFVNGKRFWRPANLILAIILPAGVLWGLANWEWDYYEQPHQIRRIKNRKKAAMKERTALFAQVRDTMKINGAPVAPVFTVSTDSAVRHADSLKIMVRVDTLLAQKRRAQKIKDSKKAVVAHAGKPMGKGEFEQWTDISTPRFWSFVENIFGEPVQLHQDHLLEDVLVKRPVIVHYRWAWSYVVEGMIFLLFLCGIWQGRRSHFLWLTLSFFGFDLVIHVVLGFGLNEVYIMSAHWLMAYPIAIGYLLLHRPQRWLRYVLAALALYLIIYNGWLYVSYLIG
ncbi:DUF6080 domain-containing protein [Prevotella sp. AGR2160]|uniref:DUF6080 domain-containing protein n=1 Tax=Prevotella sp. AGR2160 TaxID=1280674 RepID=UPI00040B86B1|nr:DUF6080 domain-containing protein [Prevotella sp. AGR2160]